jgi:hypothetical protein
VTWVESGNVLVGERVVVAPLVVEPLSGSRLVVLGIGAVNDPAELGRVVTVSKPGAIVVVVVGPVVEASPLLEVEDGVAVVVGSNVVWAATR